MLRQQVNPYGFDLDSVFMFVDLHTFFDILLIMASSFLFFTDKQNENTKEHGHKDVVVIAVVSIFCLGTAFVITTGMYMYNLVIQQLQNHFTSFIKGLNHLHKFVKFR